LNKNKTKEHRLSITSQLLIICRANRLVSSVKEVET